MRRRAYVSMLAALVAGCSERGADGGGADNESELTTTAPSTPTATPEATETDAPTDTPTPDDPVVRLENALSEGLDRYVPTGVSFDEVNGSHTDVDAADVREPLERARQVVETVDSSDLDGERAEQFEQLTGVFWFLWWVTECHEHFVTAWELHRTAWEEIYTDAGGAANTLSAVDATIEDAQAAYNNITRDSDPSDVSAFPELIDSDYAAKTDQISAELDAFGAMTDELDRLREAFQLTDRAMVKYDRENYTAASVDFGNAASEFEELADEFRPGAWSDTFESTVSEAACVAPAMAEGCARMDSVAAAAASGDESNPESAKETARDEFESCDLVADSVAIVEDFYS